MCCFVLFYTKNELQGPPSVALHPLAPISVRPAAETHSAQCGLWKINRTHSNGLKQTRSVMGWLVCESEFTVMCMFSSHNGGAPGVAPGLACAGE